MKLPYQPISVHCSWQKHSVAVLMVFFSLIFFLTFTRQALAGNSCKERYRSEHGFALVEHVYHSFSANGLSVCYIACNMQPACQSLNYNLADKICQFNNNTKYFQPEYFVEKATSVYADNPDSEPPWRKLNTAPVCFGARNDDFGSFRIEFGGSVNAIKLVHVSGGVKCSNVLWAVSSKFGCFGENSEYIHTVVTTSNDEILLPESKETVYTLAGNERESEEIVFAEISTPLLLSSGQELRIWYGEDLTNNGDGDNSGRSCVYVYAKYMY